MAEAKEIKEVKETKVSKPKVFRVLALMNIHSHEVDYKPGDIIEVNESDYEYLVSNKAVMDVK